LRTIKQPPVHVISAQSAVFVILQPGIIRPLDMPVRPAMMLVVYSSCTHCGRL